MIGTSYRCPYYLSVQVIGVRVFSKRNGSSIEGDEGKGEGCRCEGRGSHDSQG